MKTLVKKLRQFLRQCGGPTAIECAVFLAVIAFAYWAVTELTEL